MKVESSIIQNKYLRVQTLNYGASLYEVFHKNKKINLILDLGSKKNYRFKHASVGSTCGRYAGRISNSKFQISKEQYILSSNEGKNTLHGGKTGFSKLPWKKIKQAKDKIVYQLYSPDNDQGFPGNLIVVSHDRYFMDKIVDSLFVFRGDGVVENFPGNYTDYRAYEDSKPREKTIKIEKKQVIITPSKAQLTFEEKREFGSLEEDIERLSRKKKVIEASFLEEELTQDQIKEKSEELEQTLSSLEQKEERWLELSMKLDG